MKQSTIGVDALEPGMIEDLRDVEAGIRVGLEYPTQEIAGLVRYIVGQRKIRLHNQRVQLPHAIGLEREVAVEHGVEDDPGAPDVDESSVVTVAFEDFGGDVGGSATTIVE
jgi:hypothetical protein